MFTGYPAIEAIVVSDDWRSRPQRLYERRIRAAYPVPMDMKLRVETKRVQVRFIVNWSEEMYRTRQRPHSPRHDTNFR